MPNNASIYHCASRPWQYVDSRGTAVLTLRVVRNLGAEVRCYCGDPCDTAETPQGVKIPRLRTIALTPVLSDRAFDYYQASVPMETHKLRYHFIVKIGPTEWIYDETGLSEPKSEVFIRPFFISYYFDAELFLAPGWAKSTVWYQIFPDRFCRAEDGQSRCAAWHSTEVTDRDIRYGGNLRGITGKIPYFKDLGITGLYLNPIFAAKSVHRYDTIAYDRIDPGLGSEEDFRRLCEECHRSGIRVMLDGVFNHSSDSSEPFQSVLRLGRQSPYYDWFIINSPEKVSEQAALTSTDPRSRETNAYEMFSFVPSMPKWNTRNREVTEYLIGTAERWTRQYGIDAWRLDVPDEVSDEFLRTFRKRLKAIDSGIYIIGEIWSDAAHWLTGDMFDGVMNYTLYYAVRDFIALGASDAFEFADRLTGYLVNYAESRDGMFNFCGNHDVPRILTLCGGNESRALLCHLACAVMAGGLSIYYGDEVPLSGGADPDNRRVMPWGEDGFGETKYSEQLRKIIALKKQFAACRCAGVRALDADTAELSFTGGACGRVLINRADSEKRVRVGDSWAVIPAFGYTLVEA